MDKYGYGTHAVHLSLSLDTPFFRAPPRTDGVHEFGTSEYEHANRANSADPTVLRTVGTQGRLTTCGQTFYHQDLSAYRADVEKFQQGLGLFEFLMGKTTSPASKLLANPQPG